MGLARSLPLTWPPAVEGMLNAFNYASSGGTAVVLPDCELSMQASTDAAFVFIKSPSQSRCSPSSSCSSASLFGGLSSCSSERALGQALKGKIILLVDGEEAHVLG